MAEPKTERLMNLIFLLLSSRQYLTKEQIREAVPGYRGRSDVAFNRTFERDKDELRELGIPLETGSHDALFGDEVGYRIPREKAELPELDLTREEAAVIALATQVWEHAGMAGESSAALHKLRAAGVDVDTSAVRMAEPRLSADEPSFDVLWDAVTRRVPVEFDYAKPGETAARRRVLPWGILSWRDRWYLGGLDQDRDAPRLFRLTRVVGEPTLVGEPGSYEIPEGTSMRDLATSLFGTGPLGEAIVLARPDRAQSLRRIATSVDAGPDGWDQLRVPYSSHWELAAEAASYAPDVVVLEPPEIRARAVELLRIALGEESA